MIGSHPARIGRSEAGRRITAAGRAFQAAHPEESPKPAVVSPPDPPAAVGPPAPPRRADRTLLPGRCHAIIAEVSATHGVTVEAILSARRSRNILPARFEAIYRCAAETELTLAAIGRIFHRDHTTIGAAVMRHHRLTGAPLPRGMNWVAGDPKARRLRQQRKARLEAAWREGLAALRREGEAEVAAPELQPRDERDDDAGAVAIAAAETGR